MDFGPANLVFGKYLQLLFKDFFLEVPLFSPSLVGILMFQIGCFCGILKREAIRCGQEGL